MLFGIQALNHSQSDCWRKAKQQPPSWQRNTNLFAYATNVNKLAAIPYLFHFIFFLQGFGKYNARP